MQSGVSTGPVRETSDDYPLRTFRFVRIAMNHGRRGRVVEEQDNALSDFAVPRDA
jgi:hypothetical protein